MQPHALKEGFDRASRRPHRHLSAIGVQVGSSDDNKAGGFDGDAVSFQRISPQLRPSVPSEMYGDMSTQIINAKSPTISCNFFVTITHYTNVRQYVSLYDFFFLFQFPYLTIWVGNLR